MARVYLSENYPGSVVMANRPPGPEWSEAADKPKRQLVAKLDTAQLADALRATLSESVSLRRDLAESLTPSRQATTAKSFTDAVDALVASEKVVTYGDACRRVAIQQPELYEQHRQVSLLADEPAGTRL
jgi:predicted phage-related endonuclease